MGVYDLATVFPFLRRINIPLSRDQIMLLMLAVNQLLLSVETYLAHLISGTTVFGESIPILFGVVAGTILILAGVIAFWRRRAASYIGMAVFLSSIVVGLWGAYYHLMRAILPAAPLGEITSLPLIVWAPPILAPLTFCLIGVLGIGSIWMESPPDSGVLLLPGERKVQLPFSKTRVFFILVGLGCLATVSSSVLDHARTDFSNPWLWVPNVVGVFSTVVAVTLAFSEKPSKMDVTTYIAAMFLMILTGFVGLWLHVVYDLTAQGTVVPERFLRGVPVLAPMLFADIGGLGLIALLSSGKRAFSQSE